MVGWTGGRAIEQLESQMLRLVAAAVAAIGILGGVGSASAADDDYYDRFELPGDAIPLRRVEIYPNAPVVRGEYAPPGYGRYAPPGYGRYAPPAYGQYAPPVYGWVIIRPSSCGKYRYWNGLRCVDARYRPPYVGPKW
ncbi:MAG: hypothetical protein ACR2OF_04655 [Hyphomicrobium sp.]